MRYTIQVLLRSTTRGWNPFSFGGGKRYGGFTPEQVAQLEPIFFPCYMGAAEYEFGALPEAFELLKKRGEARGFMAHGTNGITRPIFLYCRAEDYVMSDWKTTRDSTGLADALQAPQGQNKVIGGFCIKPIPFFYFIEKPPFDALVELLKPSLVQRLVNLVVP